MESTLFKEIWGIMLSSEKSLFGVHVLFLFTFHSTHLCEVVFDEMRWGQGAEFALVVLEMGSLRYVNRDVGSFLMYIG